jgi:chromosome segregation ATPase
MIKKGTYNRAFEACGAFFAETGQMPTIEAIKPIIGVNSPSIISSAIKDWKMALSTTVRDGDGIDPGVPKALLDAAAAVWGKALEEAKLVIKDKQDGLQAQQTALAAKETALNEETNRVQQLVSVTEQRFGEEIGYLKKEMGRLDSEATAAKAEAGEFRGKATALEKDNAVLAEEIRQEKEKFQRLEIQYDREHAWSLKRIEEEKDSHRQKTQHEMNRLQSETARSKQAMELLQAKVGMVEKQAKEDQNRAIVLERLLSEEKLKLAGAALSEARLLNELNAKDERIRLLTTKLAKKEKKQ